MVRNRPLATFDTMAWGMVIACEKFLCLEMATVVGQRGDATLTCGSSGVDAMIHAVNGLICVCDYSTVVERCIAFEIRDTDTYTDSDQSNIELKVSLSAQLRHSRMECGCTYPANWGSAT